MHAPYGRMRNRQANQALFLVINYEICSTPACTAPSVRAMRSRIILMRCLMAKAHQRRRTGETFRMTRTMSATNASQCQVRRTTREQLRSNRSRFFKRGRCWNQESQRSRKQTQENAHHPCSSNPKRLTTKRQSTQKRIGERNDDRPHRDNGFVHPINGVALRASSHNQWALATRDQIQLRCSQPTNQLWLGRVKVRHKLRVGLQAAEVLALLGVQMPQLRTHDP